MARWARARDEYGRLAAAIGGGGQDEDGCTNDEAADHQDRDRGEHCCPLVMRTDFDGTDGLCARKGAKARQSTRALSSRAELVPGDFEARGEHVPALFAGPLQP